MARAPRGRSHRGEGKGGTAAVMCLRGAELHRTGSSRSQEAAKREEKRPTLPPAQGWEKPAASTWEGHCGGRGTKPKAPLRGTPSTNIAGGGGGGPHL